MWINMNDIIPIVLIGIALAQAIRVLVGLYRDFRSSTPKEENVLPLHRAPKVPSRLPQFAPTPRSIAALIIMTILLVLWGMIVGFGVGALSHFFYLAFIFPIAMGISSGKAIMESSQTAKIRSLSHVILVSVLSTVAMYGMFHYTRYLGSIVETSIEMFGGFSEAIEEENLGLAKVFTDYALKEEIGFSGFPGHVLYEAQEGITIKRPFRINGFHLGPVLTWLYWLLEFGIILGLTIQMSKPVSNKPVCETCGKPYGSEKHLGGTASANEPLMLDLIRQKDFAGLGKLMEPDADLPSLEVYFQGCQVCGKSQSQLVVRRASQGAKGTLQFKDAAQTILQPAESLLLLQQASVSGD
jgi:hypothetical protein